MPSALVPRLVLLFLVNMLVIVLASVAMSHLVTISRLMLLSRGSLLIGIVLAASACGGLTIAFAARASGFGFLLAIGWTLGQGYVLLLTDWFITSPSFFVRHEAEFISQNVGKALPCLAIYALSCLVGLGWRGSLTCGGESRGPLNRQFGLAELMLAVTAAALFCGLFAMFPFRDHPFLSVMDVLMMLTGSLPSIAPLLWIMLQPRLKNWHWWWVVPLGLVFPSVKEAVLRHEMPPIPGDPWFIERHVVAVTCSYVAVAMLNALILRGLGFRWISPSPPFSKPIESILTPPPALATSNAGGGTQTSLLR